VTRPLQVNPSNPRHPPVIRTGTANAIHAATAMSRIRRRTTGADSSGGGSEECGDASRWSLRRSRAKARLAILAPRLARGKRTWPSIAAAEAVATTCPGSGRFCSGRLRGRTPRAASEPRAERGAKIAKRAFARD
jgi:hypothetical protein